MLYQTTLEKLGACNTTSVAAVPFIGAKRNPSAGPSMSQGNIDIVHICDNDRDTAIHDHCSQKNGSVFDMSRFRLVVR